jgi:ubiquinone/menaquinone biosynthesis C-methylase UbiE
LVERLGLVPGARFLDVGCGTGRLAEWVAGRIGANVVGVDPLADRIALARTRAPELRFEIGRAEDLGALTDASFDAACLSAVFHWVEDKARALAELARVLCPGGRLGVTTRAQELKSGGTLADVLASLLGRTPYRGRTARAVSGRGATLTELIALLQEAGFALDELHVVRRQHWHTSGEDVLDFYDSSTFGNFLTFAPDELRPQLRADLAAAFEARREPEGIRVEDHGVMVLATRQAPERR